MRWKWLGWSWGLVLLPSLVRGLLKDVDLRRIPTPNSFSLFSGFGTSPGGVLEAELAISPPNTPVVLTVMPYVQWLSWETDAALFSHDGSAHSLCTAPATHKWILETSAEDAAEAHARNGTLWHRVVASMPQSQEYTVQLLFCAGKASVRGVVGMSQRHVKVDSTQGTRVKSGDKVPRLFLDGPEEEESSGVVKVGNVTYNVPSYSSWPWFHLSLNSNGMVWANGWIAALHFVAAVVFATVSLWPGRAVPVGTMPMPPMREEHEVAFYARSICFHMRRCLGERGPTAWTSTIPVGAATVRCVRSFCGSRRVSQRQRLPERESEVELHTASPLDPPHAAGGGDVAILPQPEEGGIPRGVVEGGAVLSPAPLHFLLFCTISLLGFASYAESMFWDELGREGRVSTVTRLTVVGGKALAVATSLSLLLSAAMGWPLLRSRLSNYFAVLVFFALLLLITLSGFSQQCSFERISRTAFYYGRGPPAGSLEADERKRNALSSQPQVPRTVSPNSAGQGITSCDGIILGDYVARSIVMLATVVGINVSISLIRAEYNNPWGAARRARIEQEGRGLDALYTRLQSLHCFRAAYVGFLLIPTFVLILQVSLLSWRADWVLPILLQCVDSSAVIASAFVLRPRHGPSSLHSFAAHWTQKGNEGHE